jgi:hypothetical protein
MLGFISAPIAHELKPPANPVRFNPLPWAYTAKPELKAVA